MRAVQQVSVAVGRLKNEAYMDLVLEAVRKFPIERAGGWLELKGRLKRLELFAIDPALTSFVAPTNDELVGIANVLLTWHRKDGGVMRPISLTVPARVTVSVRAELPEVTLLQLNLESI
jgi:hypothetical protein